MSERNMTDQEIADAISEPVAAIPGLRRLLGANFWPMVEQKMKPSLVPMPETHVASEEVRKLAIQFVCTWPSLFVKGSGDRATQAVAKLLSSALRANEERVRRETLEEAAKVIDKQCDAMASGDSLRYFEIERLAEDIHALAAQPAAGKEPSRG